MQINVKMPTIIVILTFMSELNFSMKLQLLINSKNQMFFFAFKLSCVVFIMLINVKMLTIVGILTMMSMLNFLLRRVEYEQFYNLWAWSNSIKLVEILYEIGAGINT